MSWTSESAPAESGSGTQNRNLDAPLSAPKSARRVSVQEGYALWAPTYDSDPNPALALEERTLKSLLPNLAGRHVLDVACGTGRWLERLLRWGARSGVGADFSPGMLAVATTKAALRGRLVRADCLSLPFPSARADLLICSFVMAHVRDLGGLARELSRVTKREGNVYVTDLHAEAYARGWQTSFRHQSGTVEISTFARPTEQILDAFASHGLGLRRRIELPVGQPERPIFLRAGRSRTFEEARKVPAVLICHFVRT